MVNMPNLDYPNYYIYIEISHGWRDYAIVQDVVNIMFDLQIESTEKTGSIVKNVGITLVKKKC